MSQQVLLLKRLSTKTTNSIYILVRGSGPTVIRFSAAFIMQITVSNESILVKYTNNTGADQHGRLTNLIAHLLLAF